MVRDDDNLSASLEESAMTHYAARNIHLRTRARAQTAAALSQ